MKRNKISIWKAQCFEAGNVALNMSVAFLIKIYFKNIILLFLVLNVCQVGDGNVGKYMIGSCWQQLLAKHYDNKMVKSLYNWVIFTLTQPQEAKQHNFFIFILARKVVFDLFKNLTQQNKYPLWWFWPKPFKKRFWPFSYSYFHMVKSVTYIDGCRGKSN